MDTTWRDAAYASSDAIRRRNDRPMVERHPYGQCERWSTDHTHCPWCGDPTVTHNRAACSELPEWVRRARAHELRAKDLTRL